jgi:hypothetical protein
VIHVTSQEQVALASLVYALRRLEWGGLAGVKCPACGRSRQYGQHVCSCPIGIALKKAITVGWPVPLLRASDQPQEPSKGPFTLAELTLEEWARWRWAEMTASGDKVRTFQRGKERTPDEVAQALQQFDVIREQLPGLFPEGSAHP